MIPVLLWIASFFSSQELPVDPELKRTAKGVTDQILQLRDSL
jgi:hypothetical protein